jgi:uncharacterized metal-binding protein YceD (DUF177 family)
MNYLSIYNIAFLGLKEGVHQFEFDIDDRFFEKFENSEVQKGLLKAEVTLIKQSTLMILEMTVKGKVELMCDRCLDNYLQEIENDNKLYVKFGREEQEMSDDVIVVSPENNNINIAQNLYELIILGLPIKHVHSDDENGNSTCNPDMVEKLKEYLVEEEESTIDNDPIDQRWSELKKLLDNK